MDIFLTLLFLDSVLVPILGNFFSVSVPTNRYLSDPHHELREAFESSFRSYTGEIEIKAGGGSPR